MLDRLSGLVHSSFVFTCTESLWFASRFFGHLACAEFSGVMGSELVSCVVSLVDFRFSFCTCCSFGMKNCVLIRALVPLVHVHFFMQSSVLNLHTKIFPQIFFNLDKEFIVFCSLKREPLYNTLKIGPYSSSILALNTAQNIYTGC